MNLLRSYATGLVIGAAAMLSACDNSSTTSQPKAAAEAAGDTTLLAGLGDAKTFEKAVKQSGLGGTLAGPGPYTILVPGDDAFAKLPAGTVDGLMKDTSRSELTGVLTYHILPGTILSSDIAKAIDLGKGQTKLPTMGGGSITASKEGDAIILTDGTGTQARLVSKDEKRSNGVIHRLDTVLKPS